MALNQSNNFNTMEKPSSSPFQIMFFLLVEFFASQTSLCSIQKFFSRFWFSIQSKLDCSTCTTHSKRNQLGHELSTQQQLLSFSAEEVADDGSLSKEDAEMVMGRLGIFCNPEGEELKDHRLSSSEFMGLFDEKEPSLEEVKEAFDVFDENRDGFIDARELRRVLCILGLKEGSNLEDCKKMIRNFDQNADGRIDFNEFVKFMENNFC